MDNWIVKTKNLKKYYQLGKNTVKALDGVDFAAAEREFVAIIGKSGSGKSTLLHMIGGLDEPTSGLDPENAQNVNQMISQLAKNQGITVFLCTHQLRYAQEICTRYGLMEQGRLLASGSLKQLRESILPGVSLQIRASALPAEGTLSKILTKTGEDLYETAIRSEEEIPGLVRQMVNQGGQIYSVTARRPSLEDIYFALTASGREESL